MNPNHQSPARREAVATAQHSAASSASSNSYAFRSVLNNGFRGLRGNFPYTSSGSNNNTALFPEMLPLEKRLEKHSSRLSQIRVTSLDVQRVTNDPEQFTKLQESLRQRQCMTDALIRQTYYEVIKARVKEMKPLHTDGMNSKHVSSVPVVSSPTISFGGNLPLPKDRSMSSDSSDLNSEIDASLSLEESTGTDIENDGFASNPSPTSVAVTFSLTPDQLSSIKGVNSMAVADDSEDDDIQSQDSG